MNSHGMNFYYLAIALECIVPKYHQECHSIWLTAFRTHFFWPPYTGATKNTLGIYEISRDRRRVFRILQTKICTVHTV